MNDLMIVVFVTDKLVIYLIRLRKGIRLKENQPNN
jgi:hypothetical protein